MHPSRKFHEGHVFREKIHEEHVLGEPVHEGWAKSIFHERFFEPARSMVCAQNHEPPDLPMV